MGRREVVSASWGGGRSLVGGGAASWGEVVDVDVEEVASAEEDGDGASLLAR